MVYTKQKYYESRAKFSKLLGRKLQKQEADNTIYKIWYPNSKRCMYKQSEQAFQSLYRQFYTQPNLKDEQQTQQYAISKLKTNKSPGRMDFCPNCTSNLS